MDVPPLPPHLRHPVVRSRRHPRQDRPPDGNSVVITERHYAEFVTEDMTEEVEMGLYADQDGDSPPSDTNVIRFSSSEAVDRDSRKGKRTAGEDAGASS